MVHLGREHGAISANYDAGDVPSGAQAKMDFVGIDSKILWGHAPDPDVLDAETQLRFRPDDAQVISFLASRYLAQRDWFHAILYLKKSYALTADLTVLARLSEAQMHDRQFAEARLTLSQLLRSVPDDPIGHFNMALVLGYLGADPMMILTHLDAVELYSLDEELVVSANRIRADINSPENQ